MTTKELAQCIFIQASARFRPGAKDSAVLKMATESIKWAKVASSIIDRELPESKPGPASNPSRPGTAIAIPPTASGAGAKRTPEEKE